jgi:signal transduction histidine kinase
MDRIARGLTLTSILVEGDGHPLRQLARQLESDSGITVLPHMRGGPPMTEGETVTVLRIAHQALMNAWRHSRCRAIRMDVLLQATEIVLTVSDDGVGVRRRWEFREGRLGMASMRRTVERAHGTLNVRANSPHGVAVQARLPRSDES